MLRTGKPFVSMMNNSTLRNLKRFSSTFKIAIVGSGPSGFYTAVELLKNKKHPIDITIFEKYPIPFGLSRYGVSPDHPEVKNCEETFTSTVESNRDNVKFVGNVNIGKDITLTDLQKNYNSIVFAYGNSKENSLNIPGVDHPKVIDSKTFVGWYNGDISNQINPDLSQIEKVSIIGNGNVAMDIARILLTPTEILSSTDISETALSQLKKSNVKEVKIVARRGLLESAFTTKEIRELLELEQFGVKFEGIGEGGDSLLKLINPLLNKVERVNRRKVETLVKFLKPIEGRKTKYPIPSKYTKAFGLEYLRTPVEIKFQGDDLKSIVLAKNKIYSDSPISSPVFKPTEELVEIETDLVIPSIGFKGTPLNGFEDLGVKFNERGYIENINSKVVNESNEVIPGLYVTGWIRTSKKGPIVNTLIDSTDVSRTVISDLEASSPSIETKNGLEGLNITSSKTTSWEDWELINQFEIEFGKKFGKDRWKITSVELIFNILQDLKTESLDKVISKYTDVLHTIDN